MLTSIPVSNFQLFCDLINGELLLPLINVMMYCLFAVLRRVVVCLLSSYATMVHCMGGWGAKPPKRSDARVAMQPKRSKSMQKQCNPANEWQSPVPRPFRWTIRRDLGREQVPKRQSYYIIRDLRLVLQPFYKMRRRSVLKG